MREEKDCCRQRKNLFESVLMPGAAWHEIHPTAPHSRGFLFKNNFFYSETSFSRSEQITPRHVNKLIPINNDCVRGQREILIAARLLLSDAVTVKELPVGGCWWLCFVSLFKKIRRAERTSAQLNDAGNYLYFFSTLSKALMTFSRTSATPSTMAEVLMLKDGKDR